MWNAVIWALQIATQKVREDNRDYQRLMRDEDPDAERYFFYFIFILYLYLILYLSF